MLKQLEIRRGSDEGFTLIELLIAIVVIGVLSAVVIVGIGGLTDNGKTGACKASRDATNAGLAVHYANNNGVYPASVGAMVTANELELSGGVTAVGDTVTGTGWHYTYTNGTPPVVSACILP